MAKPLSDNKKSDKPSGAESSIESEAMRVDRFATILGWMFAIAMAALTVTAVGYFYRWGWSIGDTRSDWAATGSFIGGVLSPVLGFVSLMALLLTVQMQREQLRVGREGLQGAQAELERAHDIQLTMAAAMNGVVSENGSQSTLSLANRP